MKKNNPKTSRKKKSSKVYTFKVLIIDGLVSEDFVENNPEVSRTIQMLGKHILADFHEVIFSAFDRFDGHMYEFQFGKIFNSPKNKRYGLSYDSQFFEDTYVGDVEKTRIDSLVLTAGQSFFYWFDFGDNWMHGIDVVSIDEDVSRDTYPKITERVGDSPPQYMDLDEEEEDEDEEVDE